MKLALMLLVCLTAQAQNKVKYYTLTPNEQAHARLYAAELKKSQKDLADFQESLAKKYKIVQGFKYGEDYGIIVPDETTLTWPGGNTGCICSGTTPSCYYPGTMWYPPSAGGFITDSPIYFNGH